MASCDRPGEGWTAVLQREGARMIKGRPEGGYARVFEIICCECGDHPYLDYSEVSPGLRRDPRAAPDGKAAVAAYEQHLRFAPAARGGAAGRGR